MTADAAAADIVLPPPRVEPRRGPLPHEKGPLVFLDYDQIELDLVVIEKNQWSLLVGRRPAMGLDARRWQDDVRRRGAVSAHARKRAKHLSELKM